MNKQILSVYTENRPGLLNRVTTILVKRHLNIESITACESEIKGIHRYTIELYASDQQMEKLVGQLDKQVEVVKAFYHDVDHVILSEVALYKVTPDFLYEKEFQDLLKVNKGEIIEVHKDYAVIEKHGTEFETQKLYDQISKYGLLQFARSGRVAVSKLAMPVSEILNIK